MGSYTKLKKNDFIKIMALYGIYDFVSYAPLSLGISNSNFRVKTNDLEYLLKVSNDKCFDELLGEQAVLSCLKIAEYPFSICPLKTTNDDVIYQYNDIFGVMYPFVEGIPPCPTDDTCFEIGRGLATLHVLPREDCQNGLRKYSDIAIDAEDIDHYIKSAECPQDFHQLFHTIFKNGLSDYFQQDFAHGIIHGDLYYDNTLFYNNHLKCFIDFEQSGIGKYLLDLGISLSGTCLEKGRINKDLITSYMQGYESIRPLPTNEIKFFQHAIYLGLFSIAIWRIKRFKEGNLNPLMADNYKDLLNIASLFYEHNGL